MELYQSIIEKPLQRSGVYTIFNPLTKMVYVGETNDFYYRMIQHLSGIFGEGESTNNNLKNEREKAFEIFPVIDCDYNKKNLLEKDWVAHETVVMYIFRMHGYALYNGNNDYRDDKGKKRSFLLNPQTSKKEITEETFNYLKDFPLPQLKNNETYKNADDINKWKIIISETEKEINKSLKAKLFNNEDIQNPLDAIINIDKAKLEQLWSARLSRTSNENNIRLVNKGNYEKICNELITTYLSLEDLANCGLNKMGIDELIQLINDGKFDKMIFSKFGNYLDQNPMTILSVKNYDLKNNKLGELGVDINPDKKDCNVCFWALANLNLEHTKTFLSDSETTKDSRYVLMPFTDSTKYADSNEKISYSKVNRAELNPQDSETLNDFFNRTVYNPDNKNSFAYSYSDSSKKEFATPKNMFPAVISNDSNALLISEISFIEEGCDDISSIYQYFYSILDQYSILKKNLFRPEELAYTYGIEGAQSRFCTIDKRGDGAIYYKEAKGSSPVSHTCASLKPEHKQDLINFFSSTQSHKKEKTSFVLAKIEYPYIIKLSKNKPKQTDTV